MAITPLAPLFVFLKSSTLERFPKPFSDTVKISLSLLGIIKAITDCFSSKVIPLTPLVSRPIGLASFSLKYTAFPASLINIKSLVPFVIAVPTNSSELSNLIALFPDFLGSLKSPIGVFLTTPFLVAIKTNPSESKVSTFNKLVILSDSSN